MFPSVDTKDPAAVSALVRTIFSALHPGEPTAWFDHLFRDVVALFAGRHDDYQSIDLRYHDLEHTLQATLCLTLLLQGYRRAGGRLSARQFQLAVAAALLHDAGYLKHRSDIHGTGAKYTYCHVLRSCAFAASHLPTLGATESEISCVLGAIQCTGPTKDIGRLSFGDATGRFIGCALATADYLGQMAAPDYPDELEYLFAEFAESDEYTHVPMTSRGFKSAEELIRHTPAFWAQVVVPKLQTDFQSAYKYLADPYPDGPNAYMESAAANIGLIEARIAERAREAS